MECFKCGISGSEARLFEVISLKEGGIVKLCEDCSRKEGMPVIRKPTTFQLKEAEKKPKLYQKFVKEKSEIRTENPEEKQKADVNLKEIVDRNYQKKISQEKKPREDLVDNFHWVIMRARKLRKLTRKQLAQEISESEAAIKMAEQGVLPEDDYRLVNKLESFLGIKILKKKVPETIKKEPARVLKFDSYNVQNLTIDDLRRIKKEKEEAEKGMENLEIEQEGFQEDFDKETEEIVDSEEKKK